MVNVIKATGEIEEFSENKLLDSIKRAGIPSQLHKEVVEHVRKGLYENIPTSEIYNHIEEFLGEKEPYYKAKYSLKRAIMELGPTGYPFENYAAEILKVMGYHTEVGLTLDGQCVSHEVDIIATKDQEKIFIECKFHNRPGTRSDVQVAMYTKARFDDIREKHGFTKAMLITNTKMTLDALTYAKCNNIEVLSWAYPETDNLRTLIAKYKLYPITQLTFLTVVQKEELLAKGVVLIKQICSDPTVLNSITIPENKREELMKEATSVCSL